MVKGTGWSVDQLLNQKLSLSPQLPLHHNGVTQCPHYRTRLGMLIVIIAPASHLGENRHCTLNHIRKAILRFPTLAPHLSHTLRTCP